MANSGVAGKVIDDDQGAPLSGLLVGAFEVDGPFGERLLCDTAAPRDAVFPGFVKSGQDGQFAISYAPGKYTLQVRVFTANKRFLASVPVVPGATADPVTFVGDIKVNVAAMNGWLVVDGAFPAAITGSNVTPVVDNEDCWKQVIAAVDGATSSIHWMLFYLDIGKAVLRFDATGAPAVGGRLEDALKAASARPGVTVRLVCNDLTSSRRDLDLEGRIAHSAPYPLQTANLIETWFKQNAPNASVRRLQTPVYIPIHTKFVVIDNREAFILGSPFVQDYFDSSRHAIDDKRHGTYCDVVCDSHGIRQPTHDVNLHLTGTVLGPLNDTFALHWNAAKAPGEPDLAPITPPAAVEPSNGAVQITRSLTGNGRFPAFPRGETTILDSYLRAIANASDFIYLENQYFTCEEIADALIVAVKTKPALQVILLTNNAVDIPGYAKWHPATIMRVRNGLTKEQFKRVGFFTLWSHEPSTAGGKTRICRNYVHSKVAIVDDFWATIGSANLDGASLVHSQNAVRGGFWLLGDWLGLRQDGVLTENRESETNLVVYNGDGVAGQPPSTLPTDLRQRLWAEHLGFVTTNGVLEPQDPLLEFKPAGGWLELWRTRANGKVNGLRAKPPTVDKARVLPYPIDRADDPDWPNLERFLEGDWHEKLKDAQFYLRAFGIDDSKLDLVPHYRRFSWDTQKWEDEA